MSMSTGRKMLNIFKRKSPGIPLDDVTKYKVVILGKEFSGKTSLVHRLVHGHFLFQMQPTYLATIGSSYSSYRIQLTDEDKFAYLDIWDTAGAERFAPMSRSFYRNAKGAIVCFDLSERVSFDRARKWILELESNQKSVEGAPIHVYLCGTKKDLINNKEHKMCVSPSEVSQLCSQHHIHYMETSSKDGTGVNQLFHQMSLHFVNYHMETEESIQLTGQSLDTKKSPCSACIN